MVEPLLLWMDMASFFDDLNWSTASAVTMEVEFMHPMISWLISLSADAPNASTTNSTHSQSLSPQHLTYSVSHRNNSRTSHVTPHFQFCQWIGHSDNGSFHASQRTRETNKVIVPVIDDFHQLKISD